MINNHPKRLWWVLAAAIFLITIIIGLWFQHRQNSFEPVSFGPIDEPAYQGKSFSVWLMEASSLPDDDDSGLSAIREIGTPAIPHLLRAFREGKLPSLVQRNGREVNSWEIRIHAAEALKALGPAAAAGIPSLLQCLESSDKEIRSETAEILGRTGVATKPVRNALLKTLSDDETAYKASHSLAVLGWKETNIVYELMAVVRDGKKPDAYWATVGLVDLGANSKPALPILIELINNPTPHSDWEAVKAIGLIGPDAAAAVPALIRVLEVGNPWSRKCAAISLGRIGVLAEAAIPALRDCQNKEDSNYAKADIARALWRIDKSNLQATLTAAQSIVEDELRAATTEDKISYGLMSALDLLGELGTNALPALPVVTRAVGFDDSHVQLSAAWASWQINPQHKTIATNVLWKLLDVESFPLENFGKGSFAGLGLLKRERESFHIRVAAAAMLWQIEPEAKTRLKPVLKQLLKEWSRWTSMKGIIPEDAILAPILEEFLTDETCKDIHAIADVVLKQVTGAESERW